MAKKNTMTATQFLAAIARLGCPTPYGAAPVLGVSRRQTHRYANGESIIPGAVYRLLFMFQRYGIPDELLPPELPPAKRRPRKHAQTRQDHHPDH